MIQNSPEAVAWLEERYRPRCVDGAIMSLVGENGALSVYVVAEDTGDFESYMAAGWRLLYE